MLSNRHFYHRIIRKNVVAFGTVFNEISLLRYKKNTYEEIERFKVPLVYATKEAFVNRLFSVGEQLDRAVQLKLPRMSFAMTGIEYDASRKLSNYSNCAVPTEAIDSMIKLGNPVPYNLKFDLSLYVRSVEDGTQIVEQIFPYFSPDYTLTINFIDGVPASRRDVPIILDGIEYQQEYEGPAESTSRILTWNLSFTMKTFFFGFVNRNAKIIRKATANTYSIDTGAQWVEQTVVPDPIDAAPDDDFGFTETINEFI